MDGKPNIKPTISPTDYRGSKPTDSQKKKKKKKNNTEQITKSKTSNHYQKITKAILKTKMSTGQCLTPQAQANRQRLVTSLVFEDQSHRWRSVQSKAYHHIGDRSRRSLIVIACPSSRISRHYLGLSLQASLLRCSLKIFHFTNFSLFFSLTLSLSLSLSLFEIIEMK